MAKDVYWFKHECDSILNPNLRRIQHIYAHWGKGVYWDVIEILRSQQDYKMDCDDVGLLMLASMIGVTDPAKFTNWFNDCVNFGLLEKEGNRFFSPMLTENMKTWDSKKLAGSQGGKAKALANGKQTSSKSLAESDFASGNKRREEKRIEEKIINIPFDSFWSHYNKKVGDKAKCIKKWEKLSDAERTKIMEVLPAFLAGIKDKQYQPYPETFLNQRRWENEIPQLKVIANTQDGLPDGHPMKGMAI